MTDATIPKLTGENILQQVDDMLRDVASNKKQLSWKHVAPLKKLHRNLDKYQECYLDMIITLRAMKEALRREIERLERGGP